MRQIASRDVQCVRWEDPDGDVQRNELVLFEVMTEVLDAEWWQHYCGLLEKCFDQEEILVRAFSAHVIQTRP